MTKPKQYKITATKNRFKLAGGFLLIGFMTLFYPKCAREIVVYWATYKKQLSDERIDELHK